MKETSSKIQNHRNRWLSRLAWVPGLLLVFFLVGFSILQTPFAQTKIVHAISSFVEKKTGFKIELEYANFTWYDHILLEKVGVLDHGGNEMIYADQLQVDFGFFDLIMNKKFNAEFVQLKRPKIHIIKTTDSLAVNISLFLSSLSELGNKKENSIKTTLSIDKISLTNGMFLFDDMRRAEITHGKDYNHITYDSIQAEIQAFSFQHDSLKLKINSFQGEDMDDNFHVKQLIGNLLFTKKSLSLFDFELITPKSKLGDSLVLLYDNPDNLKYFLDSVRFTTHFENSIISEDEIALFAPNSKLTHSVYNISGSFSGSIKRLIGKDVTLKLGKKTRLQGDLEMTGLPSLKETFISISCNSSTLDPRDLINLIPKNQTKRVLNAGIIDFRGEFFGFPTDFVAAGQFNTRAGFISSDINLKITDNGIAKYSGNLVLKNFDIGVILSDPLRFQKLNLSGNIYGQGLEVGTANFHLSAQIDSVGISGYNYKNIATNGDFSEGYFNGRITTHDPNLVFNGDLNIDLRDKRNRIQIQAELDTLNLQPIGLSEKDIFIASKIDTNFKGLHLDSIKGYAKLKDVKFHMDSRELNVDSAQLFSFKIDHDTHINLDTDGLSVRLNGDFKNTTVIKHFRSLMNEIKLELENDKASIEEYYSNTEKVWFDKFKLNMSVNLIDLNRFISPFFDDIEVSNNIKIAGQFISDSTTVFAVNTYVDTIKWQGKYGYGNQLEFDISKIEAQTNILSNLYISSKKQDWTQKSSTENLFFESNWFEDKIAVRSGISQEKLNNHIDLEALVDLKSDTTQIQFYPSEIRVLDNPWQFSPNNLITLIDGKPTFHNFTLANEAQSIGIEGQMGSLTEEHLLVSIEGFDVSNLNSISPLEIKGSISGHAELYKLEDDMVVESDLIASNIYLQDFLIGNINAKSAWQNAFDRLKVNFEVERTGKRIIDINGFIYPLKKDEQLDLHASFDNANLDIAQPFLKNKFSNLSGFASGNFDISGEFTSPRLLGAGKVKDGKIKINYLNTAYSFNGDLIFEENEIGVSKLNLLDNEQNTAVLRGGIFHDGFKDIILDIEGNYKNFKVLNTSSKDNKLYYGTAYATGDVNFLGAPTNLQINANAKTNKNTRISIPIGDLTDDTLEEKDYISFVNLKESKLSNDIEKQVEKELNLKGLKLDFDLEITNDAYAELIFDVTAGDIIRGRGNGNIKLQIDTNGEFNMFGDFQIEQGGYNFTLYNIINKEFDIQQGSNISWYGDPYGAQLNIYAKYRQLAALAPMINDLDADNLNSPQLRRKYPSIVDLNLKGGLLSPEISFDINIEDYPNDIELNDGTTIDLQTIITGFKAKLLQNEQEMKRQVFSLVILRKFSPENNFSVNSQTIGNSLSEFVSNQLSYWATQVDENLEVDVNLAGLDEDAFNTFQLRLSYTFLDGRLRITRGGGFSDTQNNSDFSTIIGDWTVEYLLTPDGRFRAKMYSRTNLNAANAQLGEDNTQTGFSVQFVRSFDELKRILSDSRNKNQGNEHPAKPAASKAQKAPTTSNNEGTASNSENSEG